MYNRLLLFFALLLLVANSAMAQTIMMNRNVSDLRIVENTREGLVLDYNISQITFSEINTAKGTFIKMDIPGFTGSQDVGAPELAYHGRLIAVPINANLRINIIDTKVNEYALADYGINFPIYPSQPHYKKSQDMSLVEFVVNEKKYQISHFNHDTSPISYNEVRFMRGQRIF